VKGRLARAAAATVRRGAGRTTAPWSRWFPPRGPVDDELFQGPDEPYPGHWRVPPPPWPAGYPAGDGGRLRAAFEALPPLWQAVVLARDVAGAPAGPGLGLTAAQQRRVLNQARAALRTALADPR
jgi:RNA polymerase sigma-70 factor, ECF subfamily